MEVHWRRLQNIADAEKSEWQRTVIENQEFANDIQQLRQSFGLPVVGFQAFIEWLENTEADIQESLNHAIQALMEKHRIREKWSETIWRRVIGGDDFPIGPSFSLGFPSERWWREGEEIKHQLVIDEHVDLGNPIVQDNIKHWLDHSRSTPPQPQPSKDNRRRLDWTPVWEWWKRHPDVRINDLATMLGYDRSYLSRKLNEVEERRSSHKSE
jgi:hypothetical protein